MDLSNFEKVAKAYSVKRKVNQDFRIKWNLKKHQFRFSDSLVNDMNLAENSLVQYNVPSGDDAGVYLMVVPGNTGVFYKKKVSSQKGRIFKNEMLSRALIVHGYNHGIASEVINLDVLYFGDVDAGRMYRIIIEVNPTSPSIPEPELPSSDSLDNENLPFGADLSGDSDITDEQSSLPTQSESESV